MGAHFSSKHYRRKLTMISKLFFAFSPLWLKPPLRPNGWDMPPLLMPHLTALTLHKTSSPNLATPWPKKSVPKKSLSTKKLNTKKSAKMSYPNIAVIPDMSVLSNVKLRLIPNISLDTTFPMPSGDMDMDSPSHTTSPLLLPQLPSQKNKASLQLMIM